MMRQRWYIGRHLEFCKKLKVCARVTSLGFCLRGSRWPRNRWKTSDVPKCTVHHWNALRGISSMEGYGLHWSGRYTW